MTITNNCKSRDALESQILEINDLLGKAAMNPSRIKHELERQLRRHFIITDNEALDDFEEMLKWNLNLDTEDTKCSVLRVQYNAVPFCLIVETYPDNSLTQSQEDSARDTPLIQQPSDKYGIRIHSIMHDLSPKEAKKEFSEQMGGVDEVYYGYPERLRVVWANTFWRAGDMRKVVEDQHVEYSIMTEK